MYKIINTETGEIVGRTANVRYVRRKPASGAYIETNAQFAEGVAYRGEVYPLDGDGYVVVQVYDDGEDAEALDALEDALRETDDTAIELYEAQIVQEEINAAQDEALIELYEMIGG